ncbi:MAG: hypothetical protein KJO07_08735 [Deltaproteobacteria bacterium]|nr:hypothetical protein [Deltaproteobacteria bacterium]
MTTTVLVTGAGGPLGVNATRCLSEADPELRLIGTDANRWHLPLSLCEQTYLIPLARERDSYARALADIIERERVDVVLPTHPVEVRAVAELSAAARLAAKTALPRVNVLELCDDKAATHSRLAEAGVPVPQTLVLDDPVAIDEAFRRWGGDDRAVWIRGSGAPGLGIGGAALPCTSPTVARAWVDHHQGYGRMSASELLPGANLTWMAVFSQGRLVASASRERLEYVLPHVAPSGVTGAPAVSRTVDRQDVREIGERAVRAADDLPHGAYFVDLKGDRDNRPRVTEINAGRCGTTVLFYARAGCNFPALLVELASSGMLEPGEDPHRLVEPDLYWVRTLDCGPELVRGDAGFDSFPRAGLEERD